jgi:hypothetical protein
MIFDLGPDFDRKVLISQDIVGKYLESEGYGCE